MPCQRATDNVQERATGNRQHATDISQVAKELNPDATYDSCTKLLAKIDSNHDNHVDEVEFLTFWGKLWEKGISEADSKRVDRMVARVKTKFYNAQGQDTKKADEAHHGKPHHGRVLHV